MNELKGPWETWTEARGVSSLEAAPVPRLLFRMERLRPSLGQGGLWNWKQEPSGHLASEDHTPAHLSHLAFTILNCACT